MSEDKETACDILEKYGDGNGWEDLLEFVDQEDNVQDLLLDWIDAGGEEMLEKYRKFLEEQTTTRGTRR